MIDPLPLPPPLPHAQSANQQSINILLFATVFRPCWHPPPLIVATLAAHPMLSGNTVTLLSDDPESQPRIFQSKAAGAAGPDPVQADSRLPV